MKLAESVDVGPGILKVSLVGITRYFVTLKYTIAEQELQCHLGIEAFVKMNKNIKIRLLSTRKGKATLGFEAPPEMELNLIKTETEMEPHEYKDTKSQTKETA